MTPSKQRNLILALLAAGAVILVIATVITLTRARRDVPAAATPDNPMPSGGFSFFDIDRTTVLTRELRNSLSETLGSDAIAHSTPLDLTVVDRAFLQTHLPEIAELNRGLNPPRGGRQEHNTTRLAYHRAERHQMPFRYIELVFSNLNGQPLYFIIQPTEDFADSIDALTAKYGPPRPIDSDELRFPVRIWEKDGDYLVATTIVRRNGRLTQELRIYFMDNLGLLLESEEQARRREDRHTRKAGERAF